jgi:hypothetical protein
MEQIKQRENIFLVQYPEPPPQLLFIPSIHAQHVLFSMLSQSIIKRNHTSF